MGFHEGLAAVQLRDSWAYVDRAGKLRRGSIPFTAAEEFHEGLAAVAGAKKRDEKLGEVPTRWGYIDTAMSIVIPCKFESAAEFRRDRALVGDGRNAWYIDRSGRSVLAMPN